MPLTDADILKLLTTRINASGTTVGVALEAAARAASLPTAADTTDALLGRLLGASGPTVGIALQDGYWKTVLLERAVSQLTGVDIDETAMAQQTAALIGPVLEAAIAESIAGAGVGATPKEIADAVFTRIGGAFTVTEQV